MRSLLFALCLTGVAVLSGCDAGGPSTLGAGDPVNACDGVTELNALPEPDISDRQAILDYVAGALRVIDRIDPERSVKTLSQESADVPDTVVGALKTAKTSYQRLRTDVTAATTAAKLHAAVQKFTTSAEFAGADSTVELWAGNECG
jgi:hypothetical protein